LLLLFMVYWFWFYNLLLFVLLSLVFGLQVSEHSALSIQCFCVIALVFKTTFQVLVFSFKLLASSAVIVVVVWTSRVNISVQRSTAKDSFDMECTPVLSIPSIFAR